MLHAIGAKLDNLKGAWAATKDAAGAANAVDLTLDEALQSSASSSGCAATEPLLLRALVEFPSWTTGSIYSDSARYWEPATNGWVQGYSQSASPAYKQRFVLHFDSGNLSHTCISKTTFDFLGLASSAKKLELHRLRKYMVCQGNVHCTRSKLQWTS
ncbi:unnamed protein product [Polarella glacialis]|uniref:Uncharacterized protein n=1 Tax=Polarella glacialis TaxID=89957 RepID=A0A813JXI9_POLGL|nr:unnamed protein product [Polarella glacialis]